ncbi:MAG: class I SAM-dependent methyltransferase, partial [Proteobacteria bacterium]|nr:class I SAM-dependent methyltransferase [Pseudomonadota bacterium]
DVAGGQKTGWFFDQRANRAFVAALAKDARVIDLYCFGGGFGIQAAVAGAGEVTLVDRSAAALASCRRSAAANRVAEVCQFVKAEAFAEMARRADRGDRFDIVVADPPAFVRSRKDLQPGLKGYRKLTRLAARLVAPGGFLFVASCSHNVDAEAFGRQVSRGLADARRRGSILRATGAGPQAGSGQRRALPARTAHERATDVAPPEGVRCRAPARRRRRAGPAARDHAGEVLRLRPPR